MLHERLLRVSGLVVVSEAVMEQQRIADLEQQLHHAKTAALVGETRVVQVDARRNGARATDLQSIGKPAKPADSEITDSRSWRDVVPGMLEASRSEAPILTGSMTRGSRQVSTAVLHACAFVHWWTDGGHGDGGEGYEVWRRLHHT